MIAGGWPVALCVAALLVSADAHAQRAPRSGGEDQPVAVVGDRWISLGGGAVFPLFANHALDERRAEIEQAVIVVHGLNRDADVYHANMLDAVRSAEASGGAVKLARTLVIAPQFLTERDAEHHQLPAGTAVWTPNGWKGGEPAVAPESHPSSFAALDALLGRLSDRERFPALRRLVIAGHSAGGQVVHRYAVVGAANASPRIELRFIVANPSSYLYVTAERPTDDGRGFAPYDRARCQRFDDYRYGLRGAPDYVTRRPVETILRAYAARHVVYLLGTADDDPHHRVLDRSCAAAAQGPHRLARGEAYHRYILGVLGPDAARNHRKMLVEGVGHDNAAMFRSATGRAALFAPWP
jgi:hypothetical protein